MTTVFYRFCILMLVFTLICQSLLFFVYDIAYNGFMGDEISPIWQSLFLPGIAVNAWLICYTRRRMSDSNLS